MSRIFAVLLVVTVFAVGDGQTIRERSKTLKVSSILQPPYLEKDPAVPAHLQKTNARFRGMIKDMLDRISEFTGYDFSISLVKDDKYGTMDNKTGPGDWNGMVGELQRKEVDLAAAPLTITSLRETVVSFTKAFETSGPIVLIKKPQMGTQGTTVFLLLQPFTAGVWILIIIAFIVTSIMVYSVSRFNPRELPNLSDEQKGGRYTTQNLNFANSAWAIFSILMWQGYLITPRSFGTRIIFGFWWVFSLFTIATYISNFAGQIMSPSKEATVKLPFENHVQLAMQTKVHYGTVANGATEQFFRNSKIPIYEKMWDFMTTVEPSVFVKLVDEGIERVRASDGQYAFIMESGMANYQVNQKPCDLTTIGYPLAIRSYAFAVQRNSPYLEKINDALLQLRENGELVQLQKKWFKGECATEEMGARVRSAIKSGLPFAVDIEDFALAFVFLAVGLMLGIFITVFETVCKKKKGNANHRDAKGSAETDDLKTPIETENICTSL
ncbi:glutamate receptor 2-like [Tubulanus polymorphus]|uniref:glutamate receptor 2-like n=1 Tax=Tubulanus polymorphus TaxID=672921 RepID=UPI003DA52128